MDGAKSSRPFSPQWFAHKALLLVLNIVGFMVMAGVLGFAASLVRNSLLWLTVHVGGGFALAVGVVYLLVVLTGLPVLVRDHFRGKWGVLVGGLIGFTVGATAVLAYIFAGVSVAMSRLGWVAYASTKGLEDLSVDLSESYMWHVYDLIPAIEINRTLGQDAPRVVLETLIVNGVPDHKGLLLLAFRLTVALVLFRTILRLFERPTRAEDDTLIL